MKNPYELNPNGDFTIIQRIKNETWEEGYRAGLNWHPNCSETPVPEVSQDTMLLVSWNDARGWEFEGYAYDMADGLYRVIGTCGTVINTGGLLRKAEIIAWLEVPIPKENA